MKKILLTGATGLIGATVYRHFAPKVEIVRLGRRAECELQADLSQPETLENLSFDGCGTVIHCAGITDEDIKARPAQAFIQSTLGINSLIQTAIKSGVEKFIYISTAHVYGSQAGTINEDVPANPLSDYAIAHYAAEQTLRRNAGKFKSCAVLRPNAVFGMPLAIDKFDRWTLIPYSFPLEAVYQQRIVLRSSGEQNRNFVAAQDIANHIEQLILSNVEQFSVSNPLGKETISVYQFALKCAEIYSQLTGKECPVERPLMQKESPEEEFIYQTNHNFNFNMSNLDVFIKDFTLRILEDVQNGKRYGA